MDTTYSKDRKFKRVFANILSIFVILAMAFPVTSVAYAAPAADDSKEPVGYRISLFLGAPDFPPNTPFHISHGFVQSSDDDAIGIYDFELEVDGVLRKEDFKDFWAESGEPDTLQRRWVYNFPDGMTGTHTFTGHWFGPCQAVVEDPGVCPIPNAKVEFSTQTLTVNFTPTFVAYKPGAIEGYDWPMGDAITININDSEYTAQAYSEQRPDSPEGTTRVLFELWRDNFSITTGDHIVMTDEIAGLTKDTVVTNLAVTNIDMGTRTVSGIYDPAYTLWVWLYGQDGQVPATDPDNGTWIATFAELPPGAWGGATQWDTDGDGTSIDFQVPNPRLIAFPAVEEIFGYNWPEGSEVHLTISGTDFTQTATVAPAPWDANDIMALFDFGGLYDLRSGDMITLSGSGMELTYTVLNLSVTNVDVAADTVSGTADPGESLRVAPFGFSDQALQVTADQDGNWLANFTEAGIDLVEGMCGRAEMYNLVTDNSTAVDWCIPNPSNPRIVASITEDWFYVVEFAPETTVNYSVYESQGGTQIWEGNATTDGSGSLWINADGHWDLEPGNYLVISDGTSTKDLVIEGFTFDVFDLAQGLLQGTVPGQEGRRVWVGIGFENDGWSMDAFTDADGNWVADFGTPVPNHYQWVAAQIFDNDGDASELRPAQIINRTITAGNFYVKWSSTNPEEVVDLRWKGSGNLVNTGANPYCAGDLEFFGNSWVSENEGTPDFFFGSLVGWGTSGTWSSSNSSEVNIGSISSGCPGSADIPIHTQYQFPDGKPDLMMIQRTFEFGEAAYTHDVRPFIPRLYPWNGFTQVLHPNAASDALVTETTSTICDFGCVAESWDGSWFAIHDPITGQGMIVQSSTGPIALWLDNDGASFTNSSSILLLQPDGGFIGTVTETEYLCFYDSSSWTLSLTLPEGCQP
jgi:hypothetical protein